MRRIILISIVVLVLLAGAGYGIYWYTNGRFLQHTDNAYVEADIAVIAPKISGYVKRVPVTDNQQVARGAELLVLDPADYGAVHERLSKEVDRQKAAVVSAEAAAEVQAAAITAAEAALASARAEYDRAEADRARYAKLLDNRWVPRATYEQKVAEAASRAAAVRQAEANISAAHASRSAALSSEGGARAAGASARAALHAADLDLSNTVLRAPFDGVVGNRTARVGQYVRVGQQVMVLVPLGSVYVTANFKETQIGRMAAGQKAVITVDAFPDAKVTGRVLSVSPAAGSRFSMLPPENATGNFTKIVQRVPVKIALDPLPAGLRLVPGMSVEAEIDVRGKPAG